MILRVEKTLAAKVINELLVNLNSLLDFRLSRNCPKATFCWSESLQTEYVALVWSQSHFYLSQVFLLYGTILCGRVEGDPTPGRY